MIPTFILGRHEPFAARAKLTGIDDFSSETESEPPAGGRPGIDGALSGCIGGCDDPEAALDDFWADLDDGKDVCFDPILEGRCVVKFLMMDGRFCRENCASAA
jgi:hypothetical protein